MFVTKIDNRPLFPLGESSVRPPEKDGSVRSPGQLVGHWLWRLGWLGWLSRPICRGAHPLMPVPFLTQVIPVH